ncbi:hypothetical protein [Arthrobacter sp. CJ23]|uniref:hypothetical protein n=1 Tax=Arthrobacter sp. CJ23 TaxID=2972479 RepID=UPI00215D3A53|nr:hypothetical protein [Arthrobacter sp. CJ23]UVJ38057.1 hypothetical protein NVV90_12380 [Arthrobacter sp. CJ23]
MADLDPDDAASLAGELAWLRKNEGFTQRRLYKAAIVDEVLRRSLDDTYERLKSRFLSAIYSLPDDEASLLLDVFALSEETETTNSILERRKVHGVRIGRGTETVADREEPALKHLHSRLVTGTYPQSPLVLHVPEMHGGIIYEAASTLIIIENRKWKETCEYFRFANMVEGLEYVTIGRSYDGWVNPHAGGDFKVNTRPVDGAGHADHFWHLDAARTKTEPMAKGVYDLRFTIYPEDDGEEQEAISLGSRAFHERTLLTTIQVVFMGDKPRSLWKFEQVSPFARPTGANEYNATQLDGRGIATLRLRDVHGGLFSGIAWSW